METGEGQIDDPLVLRKRNADELNTEKLLNGGAVVPSNAIFPIGSTTVIANQFEVGEVRDKNNNGTPPKNANKKKLKASDGAAVGSLNLTDAAATESEARRKQ